MKIKRGQILQISHSRKGIFNAIADKDFDSIMEEFYPVSLVSNEVNGLSTSWVKSESIPCKAKLCKILEVR